VIDCLIKACSCKCDRDDCAAYVWDNAHFKQLNNNNTNKKKKGLEEDEDEL